MPKNQLHAHQKRQGEAALLRSVKLLNGILPLQQLTRVNGNNNAARTHQCADGLPKIEKIFVRDWQAQKFVQPRPHLNSIVYGSHAAATNTVSYWGLAAPLLHGLSDLAK